jgi:hypothetical protein
MPLPNTRNSKIRSHTDSESSSPEEQHDINDQLQGRKFLEKHLLLWPAGEPSTHASLATCLHQISAMAGVAKPVLNAIRSVAYLLDELEETHINNIVKEAFDSQITEFTSDMKLLIEHAKEKIDGHLKESEGRLSQIADNAVAQAKQVQLMQPATYASTLNAPPPHANPRIAAKEGIKARQFLLEGLANTKFSHTDVFQLKTELNNLLGNLGLKNGKIRSISKLRNGGALVEMDSDASTTWMSDQENRSKLVEKMGPNVAFRSRVHSIIVYNVPLGLNTEDESHRLEVCEANSIEKEIITAMRWVKPVHRRALTQRTAHLILIFNSADAANRVITNGIFICNRRCHAERMKREPTRCLKCQGWNHFAKDCQEKDEKCGNCTLHHRTNDCPTPAARRCVSCKTDDHASWSRDCPTFIRKLNDFNDRNPENALQYIPTAEPWTWTLNTNTIPTAQPPPMPTNGQHTNRGRTQPSKRGQAPARQHDSYVPRGDSYVSSSNSYVPRSNSYVPGSNSYVPNYDRTGNRTQDTGWGDETMPGDLNGFRPLTQQYLNSINKENSNSNPSRPTNPVPTPSS